MLFIHTHTQGYIDRKINLYVDIDEDIYICTLCSHILFIMTFLGDTRNTAYFCWNYKSKCENLDDKFQQYV